MMQASLRVKIVLYLRVWASAQHRLTFASGYVNSVLQHGSAKIGAAGGKPIPSSAFE